GWAEGGSQFTYTCIGKIDWRTLLVECRIHAGRDIAAVLRIALCSIPGFEQPGDVLVRLPESPAGHFDHFDVIGLKPLVGLGDRPQISRHERLCSSGFG